MSYLKSRFLLKLQDKKEPKKRIAFMSKKREAEQREYVKIVKELLEADPYCKMNMPGCNKVAEGLHHMKKRYGNLLNKEFLIPACNHCNLLAETKPLLAIEMGLSISKFS